MCCLLWYRIGENVATVTLVDSASTDVWSIWSTLVARNGRLDNDALIL